MNLLEINNLKFGYDENLILDDLSFNLKKGDFLAISGENGTGKSTLLKIILKYLKKDGGSIKILGEDLEDFSSYEKIGYVPQASDGSRISFPVTSKEYAILGLYKKFNFLNRPSKKAWEKLDFTFKDLGIENFKDKPFNQLSGGLQQRVMIARALLANPKLLILDEPTVGIDDRHKRDFLKVLVHLNKYHGISILIITHEMDLIKPYVTRRLFLKEGRISDVSL
ncbi:MAG: ATP-binding cassette domain-containing protein [Anaerococcus sp.]|nr:ATP-binding cassette domain-containing protein [Anaerococcus sp.]